MGLSRSKTRRMLGHDFLCEKLRGRVRYFFTIYHDAPDKSGRFAVMDGKAAGSGGVDRDSGANHPILHCL